MFLDGWFKNTMETEMNTLHRSLQNLQLYPVSPHYLVKLKPHKTAYFEVNRHRIYYSTLNSKNESMS